MLSLHFLDLDNANTKSIKILVQRRSEGIARGMYRSCGIDLYLACLYAMHCAHIFLTSFRI